MKICKSPCCIISPGADTQALEVLDDTPPMERPRQATRKAAVAALDRLQEHALATNEADHDLRIVGRLLAVIATINGPGDDKTH